MTFGAVSEFAVAEAPFAPVERSFTCEPASFSLTAQPTRLNVLIESGEPTGTGAVAEYAVAELPPANANKLLASAAAFNITGRDTIGAEARRAEPASFTIAAGGANMAFANPPAAFALTGQPASGGARFTAAPAAFTLSLAPAGFAWPLSPASFTLSAQPAVAGLRLVAQPATFTMAGKAVVFDLRYGQVGPSGEGAVAEYAVAEFPERISFSLYAEPVAFSITGRPTLAVVAERAEPAAFVLTGRAAEIAWRHPPAAFTWLGQPAALSPRLAVAPAAFLIGLGAAQMAWAAGAASFTLTPQPITVTTALLAAPAAFTIGLPPIFVGVRALPGSFVITGRDIAATAALTTAPASFTWTGQDARLLNIIKMYPEPAAFTLTGQEAGRAYTLGARPAEFVLTGFAAFTTRGAAEAAAFSLAPKDLRWRIAQRLGAAQFTIIGWNVVDATGPSGDHIFLIEVKAHDGVQERTFYLGTSDFTSLPSDTPPNTYYASRVREPGNFARSLFSSGATRGRSTVGSGDIILANGDPGNGETLDDWLGYGWSGRAITIKALPVGSRSLSSASTLFNGRLSKLTSTRPLDQLELKIADRLADLDKPLLTTLFAGTTTSTGASAEGNADLKGKVKQRCYGDAREVPLQAANPYDLIYLASNGPVASITVYDGGLALVNDGDSASLAALRAASIPAGRYRTCKALGLVRLGGTPQFALSADVLEGTAAGDRTAAQIAYRMLRDFGLAPGEFITGAFTELDVMNGAACGYYVPDDRTALAAAQDVLDSIGAWLVPNRDGSLIVGRYGAPETAPGLNFDIEEQSLGDSLERVDGEIPVWRVVLQYARVHQVQAESSLAGAVTAERRAYLANEWRTVVAEDPAVKVKHLDAREMTITTYLTSETDAQAEADRQLALRKVERDRYKVGLPLSSGWAADVGLAITLNHPRLGMASGRPFNVIGREDDYAGENVKLELWG